MKADALRHECQLTEERGKRNSDWGEEAGKLQTGAEPSRRGRVLIGFKRGAGQTVQAEGRGGTKGKTHGRE